MGSIKDRNGMDLTETEDIKKRWQEYTEELYRKDLHDQDNHDGVITHLQPDILESEIKWALASITTNKATGGDGIPIELFQILKDYGVLKARILKWFAIPFSSGPHCVRPLHHDCPSWVAPEAWLSFIQLDKAVLLVWLNWLVFCEYGFSVSALWCPLAPSTILPGFLLTWAWGISSRVLQQSTAAAPYLGRGVSPYRHHSWPSTWDSTSMKPSHAHTATQDGQIMVERSYRMGSSGEGNGKQLQYSCLEKPWTV